MSTKTLYCHLDFFGKGSSYPLDTLIELGKSGFNNLLAKNNVDTYAWLASHHGTKDLFNTLELPKSLSTQNTSNNEALKTCRPKLHHEEI